MRRIDNLADAQIVINELLNFKQRLESRSGNLKGHQIKNVGAGKDPSDVVTIGQLNDLVRQEILKGTNQKEANQSAGSQKGQFKTILWSTQFSPVVGETFPFYSILTADLVCTPLYLWVSCVGVGSATLKVNLAKVTYTTTVTVDPDTEEEVSTIEQVYTNLLRTNLELPADIYGPLQSSAFVNPLPTFGVGTNLAPVVIATGNQFAVSIGLVVKMK